MPIELPKWLQGYQREVEVEEDPFALPEVVPTPQSKPIPSPTPTYQTVGETPQEELFSSQEDWELALKQIQEEEWGDAANDSSQVQSPSNLGQGALGRGYIGGDEPPETDWEAIMREIDAEGDENSISVPMSTGGGY